MTVKVCVSVAPKTINEAFNLIKKTESQKANLIEIRLDSFKDYDCILDITKYSKTPMIATIKSIDHYGHFSGTESERQKILLDAAKNGFEYVDVDLDTPKKTELIRNLKEAGAKIIVSFHDFEKTPAILELKKVLRKELALNADVCKIITTARRVKDNLTIMNFVSEASKKAKLVCFAMGELGKPSRLLSPVFGAFFTFASLDEKRKTAKGQLTIQETKIAYEYLGL